MAESRPSSPPLPEVGEHLAGKYELVGSLQTGGMGIVMAARHIGLGKAVAIKLLKPEYARDEDACQRFLREGRMAAQLTSEHVARVMDTGETEEGVPFIVMERLEGASLAAVLDERALEMTEAVDLLLQAIEAIAEAHRLGIVHRDIKPSNLFLCQRTDGSPLIKVLDFGIAKAVLPEAGEHRFTGTGQILGSPNYMSPEQVRDSSAVDHLTDVWSLGCTLYELISREPPFDAEYLPTLCAKVVADPHRPLRELVSEVPDGLGQAIDRCLAKKRRDRFPNVVELAVALEPFASVEGRAAVPRIVRIGEGASLSEPMGADDGAPNDVEGSEPRPDRAEDTLAVSWRTPVRGATSRFGIGAIVAAAVLVLWLVQEEEAPPEPGPKSATSTVTTGVVEEPHEEPSTDAPPNDQSSDAAGSEDAPVAAASSAPLARAQPAATMPVVAGSRAQPTAPTARPSAGPTAEPASGGSGAGRDAGTAADTPPPLTTAGPLADRE